MESISLTPVGYLLEPSPLESELFAPEIYTYKISSNETLYSMIFKPHNFQVGIKYPTILNVYGGPEVQLVSNTFKVSILKKINIRNIKFWSLINLNLLYILGNETFKNAHVSCSRLLCSINRFSRFTS